MIKLKLLIISLILLGPSAFACAKAERSMGRLLPAVLCAQSLLLILLGYFLPFSVCIGLLAAVSAAAWLYALVRIRDWRRLLFGVLIPTAVFALSTVFLYDACVRRIFLSYDEHSHWGLIVKVIALFDELPRMGRGAPYIQFTYPPVTAMLPALASSVLGFRDGVAYFGYALLIEGLLWGLAAKVSRGVKTAAAAALLYLGLMVLFPLGVLRLFAEPVIALLMALLILGGFERGKGSLVEDCLLACALAMSKNTGLVFLLIALAARLIAAWNRREALPALAMLLCGAAAVLSYSLYCRAQGIGAVMSPSHFGENMAALFAGTLDESYTSLPARYIDFLFHYRLPQSGVYACYGFGNMAAVLGSMLALCGVHVFIARDRRRALRLWGGLWAVNLLYMVMIVVSYFFNFEGWEVARLAEADRYTILIALWTGLLVLAMLIRDSGEMTKKRQAALLLGLAAVMLPVSHMEMTVKTFITRDYVHNTVWARDLSDRQADFIAGQLEGQEDARLLCMGSYSYVELHYLLCGQTDIGTLEKDWRWAMWSGYPEALEQEFLEGRYSHVFVAGLDSEYPLLAIDERYAPMSADGGNLKANSIYRVEHGADGSVKLLYIATMPDQEI